MAIKIYHLARFNMLLGFLRQLTHLETKVVFRVAVQVAAEVAVQVTVEVALAVNGISITLAVTKFNSVGHCIKHV